MSPPVAYALLFGSPLRSDRHRLDVVFADFGSCLHAQLPLQDCEVQQKLRLALALPDSRSEQISPGFAIRVKETDEVDIGFRVHCVDSGCDHQLLITDQFDFGLQPRGDQHAIVSGFLGRDTADNCDVDSFLPVDPPETVPPAFEDLARRVGVGE